MFRIIQWLENKIKTHSPDDWVFPICPHLPNNNKTWHWLSALHYTGSFAYISFISSSVYELIIIYPHFIDGKAEHYRD